MDRPDPETRATLIRSGGEQDVKLLTGPLREILDAIRLRLPDTERGNAILIEGTGEVVSGQDLQGWLLQD